MRRKLRHILATLLMSITVLINSASATEKRVQVVLEFSDDCGATWDGAWESNTSIVQDESLPLPWADLNLTDIGDGISNGHVRVACSDVFDVPLSVEGMEGRRWRAVTRYQP